MDLRVLELQFPVHPHEEPERALGDVVVQGAGRPGTGNAVVLSGIRPLGAIPVDAVGIRAALFGIQFDDVVPPPGTVLTADQQQCGLTGSFQVVGILRGFKGPQVGHADQRRSTGLDRDLGRPLGRFRAPVAQIGGVTEVVTAGVGDLSAEKFHRLSQGRPHLLRGGSRRPRGFRRRRARHRSQKSPKHHEN